MLGLSVSHGFALVSTLMIIAAVALLCTALFTVMHYEQASVAAHEREFRAELAVESGLNTTIAQFSSFLKLPDVGGAAFTTWAYSGSGASQHVAVTAGRPDLTNPTTPWLAPSNTIWLGTVGDPDTLWQDFNNGASEVVDLNREGKICPDKRPLPARWEVLGETNGLVHRTAVWVDDETSRLDLGRIAEIERLAGESEREIPVFESQELAAPITTRTKWLTNSTARQLIGPTFNITENEDNLTTLHSRNYRLVQWAPPYTPGAKVARGMPRRNLNWEGWLVPAKRTEMVARLTEWMRYGAPDFYRYGAPSFWPNTSGTALPQFNPPLADIPPHAFVRLNQVSTIAASILDYLDADPEPTQPDWTTAAAVHLPPTNASDVHFLLNYPLPEYFGADRCPRINEVQILWNSEGAVDNFKARTNVQRQDLGGGRYEYTIPVTFRFELWNMDKLPIPARAYAIRTFFIQQLRASTFGSVGALPVPETSEPVFLLNSGNPIAFAANEIKVFNITIIYKRIANVNRGTTWNAFMHFEPGTADDEPDGHQRQAHVLCNPDSGEWYHATNYKQMWQCPADGVCSAGIGTAGPVDGNKINDPRMEPLRKYMTSNISSSILSHVFDGERDGASNKPGKIGSVNNQAGSSNFNYQDFARWMDRPTFTSIVAPEEAVSRVGNQLVPRGGSTPVEVGRFLSVGELGRIFDPAWVHVDGRGGSGSGTKAYHTGCQSPFHGGGTLRIGQSDGMQKLAANSWNLIDLFDTVEGPWGTLDKEEFIPIETRGKVNVNVPKNSQTRSVLETVFRLPHLLDGAPGDAAREIDTAVLRDHIDGRLKKNGAYGIGGVIRGWQQCRPFYSTGEMSEMSVWENPALYRNVVSAVAGQPAGLNRGDAGREETFTRSVGLLTTTSHCYRFTVAGSVGRVNSAGLFRESGRRLRQYIVFFELDYTPGTGELKRVLPRILLQKDL